MPPLPALSSLPKSFSVTLAMEIFGPLVFSSVVATLTVRGFLGGDPLYEIPSFRLNTNSEIIPYLLLGVVAGLIAPWFIRLLRESERLAARIKAGLREDVRGRSDCRRARDRSSRGLREWLQRGECGPPRKVALGHPGGHSYFQGPRHVSHIRFWRCWRCFYPNAFLSTPALSSILATAYPISPDISFRTRAPLRWLEWAPFTNTSDACTDHGHHHDLRADARSPKSSCR